MSNEPRTRPETIRVVVEDLVGAFLYYDRKNSESLPMGAIEEAVAKNEITLDEIVKTFGDELRSYFQKRGRLAKDGTR